MSVTLAHVLHYHGPPDRGIYVGRPSIYGNPHLVGQPCPRCSVVHTRAEAIAAFERDWQGKKYLLTRKIALREIPDDGVLLCHCHPQPCHAQVIADFLNAIRGSR